MTGGNWIQYAIDHLPTWIGLLIGFLALRSKLQEIHITMNSRLTKLIEASEAVGRQKERDAHTVTVPVVIVPASPGTAATIPHVEIRHE